MALTLPFAWSHSASSKPGRDTANMNQEPQISGAPLLSTFQGSREVLKPSTAAEASPHSTNLSPRQPPSIHTPPLPRAEPSPSLELCFHAPPRAQAADGWLDTHGPIIVAEQQGDSSHRLEDSWATPKSPFSHACSVAMRGLHGGSLGQPAQQALFSPSMPAPLIDHVRSQTQQHPHKRSSMTALPIPGPTTFLAPSSVEPTEYRRHTDGHRVIPLNLHNSVPLRGPFVVPGTSSHTLVHHHSRRKLGLGSMESLGGLELQQMSLPSTHHTAAGMSPAWRASHARVPTSVQEVLLQGQRGSGCGGGEMADSADASRSFPMPSVFQLYDKIPSHMEDLHLQVCALA